MTTDTKPNIVAPWTAGLLEADSMQPIPLSQDAILRLGEYVVAINSLDQLVPFVGRVCHLRLGIDGGWLLYVMAAE